MADLNSLIDKFGPKISDFFKSRIKEIDSIVEPLLAEKKDIFMFLNALNEKGVNTESTGSGSESIAKYSKDLSVIDKVLFVTKRNGYLGVSGIADLIASLEPEIDKSHLKSNLAAVLAMEMKKESPRLLRRTNSEGKYEYMAK